MPPAVEREKSLLPGPWRFLGSNTLTGAEAPAFDDRSWEAVTVPHTWGAGTYRSAWYRTRLPLSREDLARRIYLYFDGVAAFADVYVNGAHLGRHRGAYTRFIFDATPYVVAGENVLAVRVTNDPLDTADSLPSGAGKQLYHVYGGIYRKVWLLKTPPLHIDPTDHASTGVSVTATRVSPESADLAVRVRVRSAAGSPRSLEVRSRVCDREDREVALLRGGLEVEADGAGEATLEGKVRRPRLWSPADPYLYTVWTELLLDGSVVDAVRERTGVRELLLRDGAFFLNGAPIALRGVAKHQETEYRASAVTDDDLREDFASLKDLGVNCVRLAHYPHAPLAYDLADELGILVWAENGHSNAHKSDLVGDTITREMVRQNYNHPSIVMWSVGNETGFVRVNRYAAVAKAEDPRRLVTYASNTGTRGKQRYPNLDFIAQNTYRGWYRGDPWEFEEKALSIRYVSEAGAGAVITNHTDYAAARHEVDAFEPEEYRQRIAEVHFQVVFRDHPSEVPLYVLWLLRDFATDKYKGRNTKGLLTYSGFRKDAYYLYKAFLRPEVPVVHITSKTYFLRRGDPRDGIKVYSNRKALTLFLNGESQGERRNGEYRHGNGRVIENVFYWPSPLRPGKNQVLVKDDEGHADSTVVNFVGRGAAGGEGELLRDLRSTNPRNPAYLIDQPARDQWPLYYEFDGTADNTFDRIPDLVEGARWISTRRLSKPENRTTVSFRLGRAADVFIMVTRRGPAPALPSRTGFDEAGVECRWRDNDLRLVPCRLFRREVRAGERVTVRGATNDYVVLVKERPARREGRPG